MVAFACLLPLLLGAGALMTVSGRPDGPAGWLRVAGEGWLLGLLMIAGLMMLPGLVPARVFPVLWLPVLVAGLVLLALGLRRPRQNAPLLPARPQEWPLAAAALVLLGLHAVLLWSEARMLPTLAWDAWSTWLFKARAWFDQPAFVPFVDFQRALDAPAEAALPTLAPHYPNAVPRFAVWIASASGSWSGAEVRGLWPLAWAALGAVCFGGLRALGGGLALAALATAALLSLPLLNHHAALAGYADIWMAALTLMAALRLAQWQRYRRWPDALLFFVFVALLPTIKLEGGVWASGLVGAALLMLLPARLRLPGVSIASLLVLALAWGKGFAVPMPGAGWLRVSWGEIVVPGIGALELYWRPVWREVLSALYLLPNWHLLWYMAPPVMLLGLGRIRSSAEAQALGWFLLYALLFLFGLFFLTDASRWAENLTSVNRVLLQVVPVVVVLMALALRPVPAAADTGR